MFDLMSHVVRISAQRDRTEINSAMVDALNSLLKPASLTLHAYYPAKPLPIVFPCAGHGAAGKFLHNAYLPELDLCRQINTDPLLLRCHDELKTVREILPDASQRIIYPLLRQFTPVYFVELRLNQPATNRQLHGLASLLEYFGNHIALLDYGETDTLTGLLSRKTFDKHLFELLGQASNDKARQEAALAQKHPARRTAAPESFHWLAVCDVDHFKRINDNFGHLIGDEVLIMLAQSMRHAFRFSDQLFRFGGEEFVALLQPTTGDNALATLERFRSDVAQATFSRVGHVTVSIGFSQLRPNDTPTDAMDRADEALYYAKRNGRNRVDGYEQLISNGKLTAKPVARGDIELF